MAGKGLERRTFLQQGSLALGALWAAKRLHAAPPEIDPQAAIDAHSHIWTRDVQQFPLAAGSTVEDLDPPSFTAEELLQTARPLGVHRVVLIAHHIYYGFDNSYMIDAAQRYPGTFKVVGLIDDSKPHPDVLMRALLEQHVTGFRITPSIRGDQTWLDNPGMKAMWRCAAETGQAICCLIDPRHLTQVDRMCADFPRTPVVIDHFARIGIDGQIRDSDVQQLTRLARHPNVHVKLSAYYALGRKAPPYNDLLPMIRQMVHAFGPQRLMWASDAPYQMTGNNSYAASLELIRQRADFLSADDREWILRKTAEQVYFFA